MELVYNYVESTEKPSIIQKTAKKVYLRKDISRIRRTIDGEDSYYWRYLEAKLTPKEYDEYTENLIAENAVKGADDSEHIVAIMAGQENGDENQLAIMEAIADLYNMIAEIGG